MTGKRPPMRIDIDAGPIGNVSAYDEPDLRAPLADSIAARTSGVRVQIAAPSTELGRARLMIAAIDRLLGPGAHVYDWTADVAAALDVGISERDMSDGRAALHAMKCVDAVEAADVLWLLVPEGDHGTVGAWVEAGAAIGLRRAGRRKLIIASGSDVRRSIFTRLADELHELDSSARDSIARFAAHRARAQGGK